MLDRHPNLHRFIDLFMKRRDIFAVLIGVVLCFIMILVYDRLRPRTENPLYRNINLANVNDAISKQRMNAIVLASSTVGPSVVSITVVQTRIVSVSPFNDEFFRDFFGDFFPEQRYPQKVKSLGSGVIISSDGYILTNEHVVANATEIDVTLPDSRQFKAQITALDKTNDLALLKVDAVNLPFAEFGNSSDLMIGEWVIALGNPFGFLLEDTRPTVTVGVISALNRAIKSNYEERIYKDMIQTDAAINPGNSGGPLVNILGQVVGINTFIFSSGGGSEGIGFARPINLARKFIDEARKYGRIRPAWIGIWAQDVSPAYAESAGIERRGILAISVDQNSPAERSGLRACDQLVRVNGSSVPSVSAWERITSSLFVGDTLVIDAYRQRDSVSVQFVVQEFREPEGVGSNLGFYADNINLYYARKFGLAYREGVVIIRVEKGSRADEMGIEPGDVILKIGNSRIRNIEDFRNVVRSAGNKYIFVDRRGLILQAYAGQ